MASRAALAVVTLSTLCAPGIDATVLQLTGVPAASRLNDERRIVRGALRPPFSGVGMGAVNLLDFGAPTLRAVSALSHEVAALGGAAEHDVTSGPRWRNCVVQ